MVLQDELKLKIFSQAGQVSLEFLRGRAGQGIHQSSEETIENYNEIFKKTYKHMHEVTGIE